MRLTSKIYLTLAAFLFVTLAIAGARAYWIAKGKALCENSVAVATQEKVIDNDKKLRPIRSYRPSVKRVAERMRSNTF